MIRLKKKIKIIPLLLCNLCSHFREKKKKEVQLYFNGCITALEMDRIIVYSFYTASTPCREIYYKNFQL